MTYTVKFEPNSDIDLPCCAKVEVNGLSIVAVGATWQRAEDRLTQKLRQMELAGAPPEAKEIEI